jgi:predicted nucleic acid-binding Zn ribbon protein|uniref:Uncharacterized protein n=1 Tax=Desulfobacca acetoxidans TaxID=60893 RepID=A0A7C3SLH5_9BACT
MCLQQGRVCECGRHRAYLSFRDNILTPEILLNLYCPECSAQVQWDAATMVEDCGWILEYDMPAARFFMNLRGLNVDVNPEFLFDEGYLSWQGFSPLDHEVNSALHRRLAPLIQENINRYLELLKSEWLAYVDTLKAAGWRKAQRA